MGGVNEVRKDHDFGLRMIWDGGEQLSQRPGEKSKIEENVEVGSTAGNFYFFFTAVSIELSQAFSFFQIVANASKNIYP